MFNSGERSSSKPDQIEWDGVVKEEDGGSSSKVTDDEELALHITIECSSVRGHRWELDLPRFRRELVNLPPMEWGSRTPIPLQIRSSSVSLSSLVRAPPEKRWVLAPVLCGSSGYAHA
ncbi:hypothetical protein D1007_12724 [Hordeum vulgare]|nr:hypothetical protein D1007_12724 [Hordeum vulgare]